MNSGGLSIGDLVASGDKEGLRLLLARGADVNETNKGGQTPLILAVVSNQVRLLPLLLEAGADPLLHDKTGLNAIEWAERKGLFEVASQLRDRTIGDSKGQKHDLGAGQEKQAPETSLPPPQTSEKNLADVEKSRRWIAGMKQRLDEQASRHQSDADTSITGNAPITETSQEIKEALSPAATVSEINEPHSGPESELRPASFKKCPKCGAVYNSDIVAYCSYHSVPLVDIDTPVEVHKKPESSGSNVLLWLLVIITFLSAALVGLMFLPRSDRNEQRAAPPSNPPASTWKGTPIAEAGLKTKIVDLPEAQTAVKIEKPETVVVRVRIAGNGRVSAVQGLSGNEELRRAAMDAARKATFSADKLRSRETVGTITYTFNP